MATELGVGYISIAASTQDFAKDVKSALGDFEQESRRVTDGKNGFGSKLAKGMGFATKAAGGLAVAVGGIALKKGLDRTLALDAANAKLEGLGHTTEGVEKIMDNALASVSGTAFGMGDAATVAASAVAANIKPGEDLTRTLSLIADAATIAGTDMASMGGIFNKAAASNKVQMGVINQLHDQGVPALAFLADQMGVTAEEATEMASAGEISFETFQLAMEEGLGGAAQKSGETAQGAWNNMLAALGRVGEKITSKVLPHAVEFFAKVMDWANDVGPHVEAFADAAGEALSKFADWGREHVLPVLQDIGAFIVDVVVPAFQDLGGWITGTMIPALKDFGKWVVRNKDWLISIAVGVGTVVGAYGLWIGITKTWQAVTKIATTVQRGFNLVMKANPIMLVISAVAALVAGLIYFFTQTETGREIWAKFTGWLSETTQKLADWWHGLWEGLGEWWSGVWTGFKETASAIWDSITEFISAAGEKIVDWFLNWTLPGLLIQHWDSIKETASRLWNGILDFFREIPTKITNFFSNVGAVLSRPFEAGQEIAMGAWDTVLDFFKNLPTNIGSFFSSIKEKISAPFKMAFNAVAGFWNDTVGQLSWTLPDWVPMIGGNTMAAPTIPMLASGGTATAAGWSIVGEAGPELLHLPRGASVVPLDHPASEMSGGSGMQMVNHIYGATNAEVTGMIETKVRHVVTDMAVTRR